MVTQPLPDVEVCQVLVKKDGKVSADRKRDGRRRTLNGGNTAAGPTTNRRQRRAKVLDGSLSELSPQCDRNVLSKEEEKISDALNRKLPQ
jgi:hypothetical protein